MFVHAGGGLPPSHVAGGASWAGLNLASPMGNGVDLRAVAGVRQEGEVLWSGAILTMAGRVQGTRVAVPVVSGSTEPFAVHAGRLHFKVRSANTMAAFVCTRFCALLLMLLVVRLSVGASATFAQWHFRLSPAASHRQQAQ